METNVIKVGNSKGIIIPAKLLKLIGLKEKATLEVEGDKIIIKPAQKPRAGWEEMILKDIEKHGKPEQLIPDIFEDENLDDIPW